MLVSSSCSSEALIEPLLDLQLAIIREGSRHVNDDDQLCMAGCATFNPYGARQLRGSCEGLDRLCRDHCFLQQQRTHIRNIALLDIYILTFYIRGFNCIKSQKKEKIKGDKQINSPIMATNRPRKKVSSLLKLNLLMTDVYHRWCHFLHCKIIY